MIASPFVKAGRRVMLAQRKTKRAPDGESRSARKQHAHEHWGGRNVAYEYAKWQLDQIAEQSPDALATPADPIAKERMLHHLRSLLSRDTLYPTMSVDEDGDVVAEWRVLEFGIELVTTNSKVYWVLRQRGRRKATSADLPVLRSLLRTLTAVTEQLNPGWRRLFPKAEVLGR